MNANRAYEPLFGNGGNVVGFMGGEASVEQAASGLYFRDAPEAVHDALRPFLEGKQPMSALPLDLTQTWIDSAWKTRHASRESVERFGGKLQEEMRELREACHALALEPAETTRLAAVSELGDVLFAATALANNSGCRLAVASSARIGDFMDHARAYTAESPTWWEAAATVQQQFAGPTLGELQDVVDKGFVPHSLPLVDASFSDVSLIEDIDDALRELAQRGQWLEDTATRQRPGDDADLIASTAFVEMTREDIGPAIADVWSLASYVARYYLRSDLAETIAVTINKVNNRVKTGTIDKSDGDRDTEGH